MNIGIVTTWFERGAAYVSKAYMTSLSRDHSVFIYARGGDKLGIGDSLWDLPKVTWQAPVDHRIVTYIQWKQFKKWVLESELDAVIFNEQHSWMPVVRTIEELPVLVGAYVDYYTPGTVEFFKLYDFLLCNTRRHHGVFADHPAAFYIPWGTDIHTFRPNGSRSPTKNVTFFHSSGMSPFRKGTDLCIDAFAKVQGQAQLVVHSQGPLRESREWFERIAQDSRITLIEKEVGAPGLYHFGDVYVYPSRLEGIGLTIAEALACGLPVIATDSPPMSEFVVDGVCGKLVEVDFTRKRADNYYWPESFCSRKRLTEAMQFFVDNKELLPEFKQRARVHAEQHLDWSENSRDLGDRLESLTRVRKPTEQRLREAILRHEKARDPGFGAVGQIKLALRKVGAHHVKHWLSRRLRRRALLT